MDHSIWASFVPRHLAEKLASQADVSPIGDGLRQDAITLFADISGFTAISEALGGTGKTGTEELTALLNSYFEPMIDLIFRYGGIIGKFGGDAMTVLFFFKPENHAKIVQAAVQCALEMQKNMGDYSAIETSAGIFGLEMRAGLAAGPIFTTIAGLAEGRLEYIIAGSALDRCADAQKNAKKGEVVVHEELISDALNMSVTQTEGAFYRVDSLEPHPVPHPTGRGPIPTKSIEPLKRFLHRTVTRRIETGKINFINEHRMATILFVGFSPFDYDNDSAVGDKLQAYLEKVLTTVNKYDGYLNKVDMGDKGSKYLIVFGAPVAHENDVERALRCASELREIEEVKLQIGINTGFVYCGQVGSPARQEYTVMGGAVNVAARLTQASTYGEILIADGTFNQLPPYIQTSTQKIIRIKEGEDQITAYALLEVPHFYTPTIHETQYTLPLVGRKHELNLAAEKTGAALKGQGQIVALTAEAGMGKSRLAAEVLRVAREQGLVIYAGECLSHGTNTPYLVWRNLFRGLFGLGVGDSLSTQISQLEAFLSEMDPALLSRLPLLGAVLNLPIPETDLTRALDPRLKKSSLENLIVDCIRHASITSPLMLALEDLHWIDALSNDLLAVIGRSVVNLPVFILAIHRPLEHEIFPPGISRLGHYTQIELSEFEANEVEELIALKLNQQFGSERKISTDFIERINERAQGNPFFIDEMLNLIHDRGINPETEGELEAIEIPDSLHSLIISRIDQLDEDEKTTLRVASVIGRLFKAGWLWGIYPQLGQPEDVKAQLDRLSSLEITPLDKPEPELEYIFKHIITREVAYESLAVSTREMLHGLTGNFIETAYSNGVEQYLDVLAYHFGNSPDLEKRKTYYFQAGEAAKNKYANDAALAYYRALNEFVSGEDQVEVLLQLGEVAQFTGDWTGAEDYFNRAEELVLGLDDAKLEAETARMKGTLLSRKGSYSEALEYLNRARKIFETQGYATGVGETLREIGIIHWSQGNNKEALSLFEAFENLARKEGDKKGVYKALGNQGIVYQVQDEIDRALSLFQQSYEIAREIQDLNGANIVIGNMGTISLDEGDFDKALTYFRQNLETAREIGDRQGVGIAVGNMGNVYREQGDFENALICGLTDMQIALEIGDRYEVGFAGEKISLALMALDRFEEAEAFLVRAIKLGRILESHNLCVYLLSSVELFLANGLPKDAYRANLEALQLSEDVHNSKNLFETQIQNIRLQKILGDLNTKEAIRAFEDLLVLPAEDEHHILNENADPSHEFHDDDHHSERSPVEIAQLNYEIWRLDPEQEAARLTAADIYKSLFQKKAEREYNIRYEEMTGLALPTSLKLPPLPDIIAASELNIPSLIEQIDAVIIEAESEGHEHDHH